MSIKLSSRVQAVRPSPTLAITARAAEMRAAGKDVIGLGAGEPDFDTPSTSRKRPERRWPRQDQIHAGRWHSGLKQAIIAKFKRDNALDYAPEQILVSCGGKQSSTWPKAMLDPGDEVIIPAPPGCRIRTWRFSPAACRCWCTRALIRQFKITPAAQLRRIDRQDPPVRHQQSVQPTGMAYDAEELAALGEVLRDFPKVAIATDDMYEHIRWNTDGPFVNIVNACPDLMNRTLVLSGVSKAYSMTGWRIGYARRWPRSSRR